MAVSPESVKLLTEVGFAAASAGLSKEALAIFAGIKAVRPESEASAVGAAMAHLGRGSFREAVDILREEALVRSGRRSDVLFMLALALKLDGRAAEFDTTVNELRARASKGDAVATTCSDSLSKAFGAG